MTCVVTGSGPQYWRQVWILYFEVDFQSNVIVVDYSHVICTAIAPVFVAGTVIVVAHRVYSWRILMITFLLPGL